jgi:hypothetical protein
VLLFMPAPEIRLPAVWLLPRCHCQPHKRRVSDPVHAREHNIVEGAWHEVREQPPLRWRTRLNQNMSTHFETRNPGSRSNSPTSTCRRHAWPSPAKRMERRCCAESKSSRQIEPWCEYLSPCPFGDGSLEPNYFTRMPGQTNKL